MLLGELMRKFFFILFILISGFSSASNKVSVEQKIANQIKFQYSEQLNLLEKLVNINSGTSNIVGIEMVGHILSQQFNQLGFKTYWVKPPASLQRAGTLVAEHKGNQGKRLLLIGHLDTVFPKNSPFQRFERHGDIATGPGIIDDKGGDVVILYALKALQSVHALDHANITVILTGDEEDAGMPAVISRKALFAAAKQSDIALDFEWAITADTATAARRGISHWTLQTHGKQAHSSQIFQPEVGNGSIFELARILNKIRMELSNEKSLTLSPGLMFGGTTIDYKIDEAKGTAYGKDNVVAQSAFANGDLRYLNKPQLLKAKKKIVTIVNQHLSGTDASIQFQDTIPSMPLTSANKMLLNQYSKVSEDLGYGAIKLFDPAARGAGDISYVASLVSGSLAGLGVLGNGAHSVNETLNLKSLTVQTQRAALLIYRLIQEEK